MGITKMLVESLWGFPYYGGVRSVGISQISGKCQKLNNGHNHNKVVPIAKQKQTNEKQTIS